MRNCTDGGLEHYDIILAAARRARSEKILLSDAQLTYRPKWMEAVK
jgi:hypothetical protein